MKIKITKEEVIEAIVNEPILMKGAFFHNNIVENIENCPVCAVGSVLRNVAIKNNILDHERLVCHASGVTDFNFLPSDLEDALLRDNFLGKLSCFFESTQNTIWPENHLDTDEERRMLCLFVTEAFCPDSFEIEL
jgi:hypothetical protein